MEPFDSALPGSGWTETVIMSGCIVYSAMAVWSDIIRLIQTLLIFSVYGRQRQTLLAVWKLSAYHVQTLAPGIKSRFRNVDWGKNRFHLCTWHYMTLHVSICVEHWDTVMRLIKLSVGGSGGMLIRFVSFFFDSYIWYIAFGFYPCVFAISR